MQKKKQWIKKYFSVFLLNLAVSLLIYFMMMSESLVNDVDGIWHTSNFIAGDWEISLGRGVWRYLDKLRFGVVSVPLNTILTVCLITVANCFLIDIFEENNTWVRVLGSLTIAINPIVTSTLSYSYAAFNFGAAYLFSVLAAFLICKGKNIVTLVIGAGFLALSMGNYQAYFGVSCVILMLYFLKELLNIAELKELCRFLVRAIIFVVAGGIFYVVLVNILLFRAGITLASYKGAENATLINMLKALPTSLLECYRAFSNIVFGSGLYCQSFGGTVIIKGIAILTVCLIFYMIWRLINQRKWIHLSLFILCIALLPVGMNGVLVLAVGQSMTILMSMGMTVGVVMLPQVLNASCVMKGKSLCTAMVAIALSLLLWCNILTVSNDQVALKREKQQ